MLKGIDPLLDGEALLALDQLGHGDLLALVDRNFPAHRYHKPVLSWRGVDTAAAASAILSVLPLDQFDDRPLRRMAVDDAPTEVTAPSSELLRLAQQAEGLPIADTAIDRQEFYRRALQAQLFIQTGETVGYSCYLLRKGVV